MDQSNAGGVLFGLNDGISRHVVMCVSQIAGKR